MNINPDRMRKKPKAKPAPKPDPKPKPDVDVDSQIWAWDKNYKYRVRQSQSIFQVAGDEIKAANSLPMQRESESDYILARHNKHAPLKRIHFSDNFGHMSMIASVVGFDAEDLKRSEKRIEKLLHQIHYTEELLALVEKRIRDKRKMDALLRGEIELSSKRKKKQ